MTISRSSSLSVNVLLIFDIHELNGVFLKLSFLFLLLALSVSVALILPFQKYSFMKNIVLNVMFLLVEY